MSDSTLLHLFTSYTLVCMSFFTPHFFSAGRIPVDSIKVVIYGPEQTDLITSSDLERPGIDGSLRSIEDMVYERLMFQEALRFNVVPDEKSLDKYLQEIQREHDMTEEDLRRIFREAGYTYAQGRTEFGRIKAVNQVMGVRVMSKLTVPQREIDAYYQAHPEYKQARYYLKHAIAPLSARVSTREKDAIKTKVSELLEKDVDGDKIAWIGPYWLDHDQVAENKQFIYDLKVGEISDFLEVEEGLLVFTLVEKEDAHMIPLEERYEQIVNTLRQPKFGQQFTAYKQELENNAAFIYF